MSDKKYPWSKRDDPPAKCVYAGPEYYKKKVVTGDEETLDLSEQENEKDPPASGVCAGPAREEEDAPMNDVYAGPEFFEKDAPSDGEEPTDLPEPKEEESDADPGEPEVKTAPPEPMCWAVYAGPEYWNPGGPQPGAYMPAPPPEKPDNTAPLPEDKIYCPNCGMPVFRGKFCSECGTPLNNDE